MFSIALYVLTDYFFSFIKYGVHSTVIGVWCENYGISQDNIIVLYTATCFCFDVTILDESALFLPFKIVYYNEVGLLTTGCVFRINFYLIFPNNFTFSDFPIHFMVQIINIHVLSIE